MGISHSKNYQHDSVRWHHFGINNWTLYIKNKPVGPFTDEQKRLIDLMMLGKGEALGYSFLPDNWAEIRPLHRV